MPIDDIKTNIIGDIKKFSKFLKNPPLLEGFINEGFALGKKF